MGPIFQRLTTILKSHHLNPSTTTIFRRFSTTNRNNNEQDTWNDAWETAWLPDDISANSPRAPWESDVTFSLPNSQTTLPHPDTQDIDPETQAFVADMNDNWEQRKGKSASKENNNDGTIGVKKANLSNSGLYGLENIKRDYRLRKQKIHAGLWVKEIEKMEEDKLGDSVSDDLDKFLDSASEIFDSTNSDFGNSRTADSEFKNKPDGWETTSKTADGNVWDITQREEDILVQEFERRIAFNKFQIASFIKSHIFSRRRPIDGWKYMIEEIGPNARRSKGSVSRVPSVSDESTQPFKEEKPAFSNNQSSSHRGR